MSKMYAFKLILKWGIYCSPVQPMDRVNALTAEIWGLEQNANGHRKGLRKQLHVNLTVREARRNKMTYIC